MGIADKIRDIELELGRTQVNKATEYHRGLLKAKLARYRLQLLEESQGSAGGGKGEGFDVARSGDARVVLIGFPSVGKSTALNKLTGSESVAAAYEFTTLTAVAGKIHHRGSVIQLVDLPGIITGAADGKGRGRQVIAVARTADMIVMMLDATKSEQQRALLEAELHQMGIRLNKTKPNIAFKVKKAGGIKFNATCKLTMLDERIVYNILHTYKIFNADVLVREDASIDDFLDVVIGNRKYLKCLYVYNKVDSISLEQVDKLAREPDTVVVSVEMELNLDFLVDQIYENLNLLRIYTKRRGDLPDFAEPIILRRKGTDIPATIEQVCASIHKSLVAEFKYALVWGASTKYSPQRVGLGHVVENEDVVQIVKKR
ncbi:P-loop containing nucleoside triphosphate hydrolase protein [Ramicandelaber brevisporus]|nr:P-loop containing nucleoside triphosphate hydrolase protein [Ramicandelaber brevisporus]